MDIYPAVLRNPAATMDSCHSGVEDLIGQGQQFICSSQLMLLDPSVSSPLLIDSLLDDMSIYSYAKGARYFSAVLSAKSDEEMRIRRKLSLSCLPVLGAELGLITFSS